MATSEALFVARDGLVLRLEPAEEGGFIVTCPDDDRLVTQAETVDEAFEMARDAISLLDVCDSRPS